MRKLIIFIALLVGIEGAALACSCVPPGTPEESRDEARYAVRGVVAIVEAEVLSEYRPGGLGEQIRVHRTLFGEAPQTFIIERSSFASSASCDLLLNRGERKVLILAGGDGGIYRIQNLCSDYLTSERYLPIVLEEARLSSRRAGERAANCPKTKVSGRA
ncbi:MAG TPA: hypothetical protein VGD10_10330 [Allosphingosinicella sp.]|uniref:hypothetical protein n=1 Tax=Allosphingosinicella sp. TaxID=2823234 RepID=UPI002EDA9BDE